MKHVTAIERMENTCIAVGHFEGVHRGHLAVVSQVAAQAKQRGLTSVIVSLCDPTADTLTTEAEKEYLLRDTGIDVLISLDQSALPAHPAALLDAKVIVTCARGGCAHAERSGAEIVLVPGTCAEGELITASLLRQALETADMDRYEALAGHPYLLIGKIVRGKQLGRTVGQPTANLAVPDRKLKPAAGVYATISSIEGKVYMGMTNIGKRPSVDNYDYVTIETNLLDFSGDIYDKVEILEVYVHARGVMKFDHLEQVKAQVGKDKEQIRTRLTEIAQNRGIQFH